MVYRTSPTWNQIRIDSSVIPRHIYHFLLSLYVATILSQPSSSTSPPFKATAVASSIESDSPTHKDRKTSRRISAKENLNLLERFRKPTQDDMSPVGKALLMVNNLLVFLLHCIVDLQQKTRTMQRIEILFYFEKGPIIVRN